MVRHVDGGNSWLAFGSSFRRAGYTPRVSGNGPPAPVCLGQGHIGKANVVFIYFLFLLLEMLTAHGNYQWTILVKISSVTEMENRYVF